MEDLLRKIHSVLSVSFEKESKRERKSIALNQGRTAPMGQDTSPPIHIYLEINTIIRTASRPGGVREMGIGEQ